MLTYSRDRGVSRDTEGSMMTSGSMQRPSPDRWTGEERRVGGERRRGRVYRFIDRRSGFDRRRRYPVLGTMRDHPWLLIVVLALVNALSLIDGLLTAAELAFGLADEGNPVLRSLIDADPLLAVAFKVGIVIVVSVGIWRGRHLRVMLALSLLALAAYAGVLAYHLGFLSGSGVF